MKRIIFLLAVAVTLQAQITNTSFGTSFSGNSGVTWPTNIAQPVTTGIVRLWDSATRWDQLETANGVYNWSVLDADLQLAALNNQKVIFTFGGVPQFASSTPLGTGCGETAWGCYATSDIATDGSGTDAYWKAFITALMQHLAATGESIQYFEPWNEINSTQWWLGTAAQMVRMAYDARTIIKSYNSAAVVMSPSTCACNNTTFTNSMYTSSNPQNGMQYYLAATANVSGTPSGGAQADAIAIHDYQSATNPPENVSGGITGTKTAMTTDGFGSLPLYMTEDGWGQNNVTYLTGCTTNPPFTQSCLDEQASYLARLIIVGLSNGLASFDWYAWGNNTHGTLYNTSTGFLYEDGLAYNTIMQWLTGATFSSACSAVGNVYTCALTKSSGANLLVVWDKSQTCSPCTTSSYTVPSGYYAEFDLAGDLPVAITPASTIQIGLKPVLLTNAQCTITNPTSGEIFTQSGPVQFAATVANAPGAYKLPWQINFQEWATGFNTEQRGMIVSQKEAYFAPFGVTWYSALHGDGALSVEGYVYNTANQPLAACAPVYFTARIEGMSGNTLNMLPNYPYVNAAAAHPSQVITLSPPSTTKALWVGVSYTTANGCVTPTISSTPSNTWIQGAASGGVSQATYFYVRNPSVAANMTITLGGSMCYTSGEAFALTNVASSGGIDVSNSNTGTGTSITSGSVTPTANNETCLVQTATGAQEGSNLAPSLSSPFNMLAFTIYDATYGLQGGYGSYDIQTTATAVNETLYTTNSIQMSSVIACLL